MVSVRWPRGFEGVVIVWLLCLTLFFVNQTRIYDKVATWRVEQERVKYKQAVQNLFERENFCISKSLDQTRPSSLSEASSSSSSSAQHYLGKPVYHSGSRGGKIALLLMTYNRQQYLQKTMDSVLKYAPRDDFPIIISQDGDAEGMAQFIRESYVDTGIAMHIQNHPRVDHKEKLSSYYYIADHFKFALGKAFDVLKFDTVVILEDDMEIAPDFFSYFHSLAPLLHSDSSLLCVSAWNDNGMQGLVSSSNSRELRRTSCFPGLGWMLTRQLWEELKPQWPKAFWDDWLREPDRSKGRDCIYPVVSRTRTFGEIGSSVGQFFSDYLSRIVLNQDDVNWSSFSFSHLDLKEWSDELSKQVSEAAEITYKELGLVKSSASSDLRLTYRDETDFKRIAHLLGLMDDFKAGIPRASFRGVSVVYVANGHKLFLVPSQQQF